MNSTTRRTPRYRNADTAARARVHELARKLSLPDDARRTITRCFAPTGYARDLDAGQLAPAIAFFEAELALRYAVPATDDECLELLGRA